MVSLRLVHTITRRMSTQAKYLIDDPKYGFLKELGLDRVNAGVYYGQWKATGQVTEQIVLKAKHPRNSSKLCHHRAAMKISEI